MTEFWTLHDIAAAARNTFSKGDWDFIVGGTETETTLRRNRAALDALALRPRVLRDVSSVDCTAESFGQRLRLPVFLAPIGRQEYGGGPATAAAAAAEFGCGFMFSSVNGQASLEEVTDVGPKGATVYQLYVRGDRDWVKRELDRAVALGCPAFCVTVDTPVISRRERDLNSRFTSDRRRHFQGAEWQASFNWSDIAELRKACPIPLIVKGIQDCADALIAIDHGVDVIYISNHGGRQTDHTLGSIDVLRETAEAVQGRAKLYVDGGFLRGSDIVKAKAAGADMIGIGKLFCLALGAGGKPAVLRMLEILEEEVLLCLSLIGARSYDELSPDSLREARLVPGGPDLVSAFPSLAQV